VLLTPHTAGHGEDSMADNRRFSIDQVVRFLAGEAPETLVDRDVRAGARARARALVRG
jgi:phosphoglycerate dehydrogenase-like enzyme